ncbi:ATP-binding cassette domain-containing protein [Pseudanabaena sp. 'Roaring Creek']|uniref:ATP-binding cassette domain-containing protein n=1 Tax=Pseudanabaena sp. 'Roaring Creek' TaxID=1681830 RepID=UPI000A64AC15|nr:ATP-binding cassette domain-containing protein [Pseudanabaena sp. 'Roaring Creek']
MVKLHENADYASEHSLDPNQEHQDRDVMIETRSLTRDFGQRRVVDSINLQVKAGEIFGLLGPNGAGKSTTIKMLTTLLPPSSGSATIAGLDIIHQPSEIRRAIGYVPQSLSADGSLTAYENLLIFSKLYDIPHKYRASRINDVLEFMGLTEAAHRLVRQYSGGMIRRLEVAQSMLHQPQVLFLDEPTVGLDPLARSYVWALVQQLRENYGTTIILTTHFLEEADSLCDRVAIMQVGKVVVTGVPSELKANLDRKLDRERATLDDVFIHYTGNQMTTGGGSYRETSRNRRTAQRLG